MKLTRSDLEKVIASYAKRKAKHLFFSVFAFACVSVPSRCLSAQIYCSFSSKSDHTGVSTGSALGKWATCSHPKSSHTKAVPCCTPHITSQCASYPMMLPADPLGWKYMCFKLHVMAAYYVLRLFFINSQSA